MKAQPVRTRSVSPRSRDHLAEAFERANRQAAMIILAERLRYSGLPLVWAEAVLRGVRPSVVA